MATVDGTESNIILPIEDQAMTGAVLWGSALFGFRNNGNAVYLGDCVGDQGPQGDPGVTTYAMLAFVCQYYEMNAWVPLALTSNWIPYPGFGAPRIRTSGYRIEMAGLARYVGSGGVTSGSVSMGWVPSGYEPAQGMWLSAHRNGSWNQELQVSTGGHILAQFYSELPSFDTNEWICLDGLSYPIT